MEDTPLFTPSEPATDVTELAAMTDEQLSDAVTECLRPMADWNARAILAEYKRRHARPAVRRSRP